MYIIFTPLLCSVCTNNYSVDLGHSSCSQTVVCDIFSEIIVNFQSLEVVDRGSETQLQVAEN